MSTVKPRKHANLIGKPPESAFPAPVSRALRKLGADIALARRRRHLTQASMAERLRISEATVRRMEHGDTGISIGTIVQAFFVLGELQKITHLLDTASDEIGLALMNEQLPQRVHRKRVKSDSGAL
ncbi:MAG: helix-turn-helix domain-containing protein [Trinickia sp.]|uniref:helix-turn-helix domain-containing protein n=1 Tax=Trinickia sp. TaxID=2571163 RepID=UPI003F81EED9